MTNYWYPVEEHEPRQYLTGETHTKGGFVDDEIYASALDHLVLACVDAVVLFEGRVLIGKRVVEPQPDWWIIGGRMRKGDLYQEAAVRNMKRELQVEFAPDRFNFLNAYNLLWDKRAQEPTTHGCHMLSITMYLQLTEEEHQQIRLNEEYGAHRWVEPNELISDPEKYHPCLVQMARDIQAVLLRQRVPSHELSN